MTRLAASRLSRQSVALLAIIGLLLALLGTMSTARATEPTGGDCPDAVQDRVTSFWYTVTRGADTLTVSSLDEVQQGDWVELHFVIADGCSGVDVRINSYQASGNTHETSNPQKLFDKAMGTFDAGTHALGPIQIPECFFQADVVVMAINGNQQQERFLLDATLSGENSCVESAALSISKGPDGGSMAAGGVLQFTITVRNDGDGVAHGVMIEDPLPSGFTWTESPDKAQCSISADVLSCSIGDLNAGASFSVRVSTPTDAEDCGLVENTASTWAEDADEVSNRGTVTLTCEEATPTPTPEQEQQGGTPTPTPTGTPEQQAEAGSGTPAASLPNSALGVTTTSALPTVLLGVILLMSLGTLAWVNVRASGRRR